MLNLRDEILEEYRKETFGYDMEYPLEEWLIKKLDQYAKAYCEEMIGEDDNRKSFSNEAMDWCDGYDQRGADIRDLNNNS